MADKRSMLYSRLSFVILTLAVFNNGVHGVNYFVFNEAYMTPGGMRFISEIGNLPARQNLVAATTFIRNLFRQSNAADQKLVPTIVLRVEDLGPDRVAFTDGNNNIHLNAQYIAKFHGNVQREVFGILYHEMAHVLQWTGGAQIGLIEGIADFVRFKAGLAPPNWPRPGDGKRWDEGYGVTARFLDYCESLRNGFVAELNKKMRTGYSHNYFVQLLGKNVDQLWKDYKRKYGREL